MVGRRLLVLARFGTNNLLTRHIQPFPFRSTSLQQHLVLKADLE